MTDRLLLTGIAGSAIAAICCFTPALPVVLSASGAGGLTSILYRDALLLPVLAAFLLLTGYALWRRRNRP